jgi:hypothetical protein
MLDPDPEVLKEIVQALRKVSHGSVQILVQDSRVVQIETLEKKRIKRP